MQLDLSISYAAQICPHDLTNLSIAAGQQMEYSNNGVTTNGCGKLDGSEIPPNSFLNTRLWAYRFASLVSGDQISLSSYTHEFNKFITSIINTRGSVRTQRTQKMIAKKRSSIPKQKKDDGTCIGSGYYSLT